MGTWTEACGFEGPAPGTGVRGVERVVHDIVGVLTGDAVVVAAEADEDVEDAVGAAKPGALAGVEAGGCHGAGGFHDVAQAAVGSSFAAVRGRRLRLAHDRVISEVGDAGRWLANCSAEIVELDGRKALRRCRRNRWLDRSSGSDRLSSEMGTRAALFWLCLAAYAPLACGGRSQNRPVTSSAGAAGASSAASGYTNGGVTHGGSPNGAAGTLTDIDINYTCDLRAAAEAACRAKYGEPFVDFKLGANQGRYTHGCDPQCGERQGPQSSADFEKGSRSYIAACELGAMVSLTFDHVAEPSQIGIYPDRDSPSGTEYVLSDWAMQPLATDANALLGTAQAVNLVDAADTATLELSYRLCP